MTSSTTADAGQGPPGRRSPRPGRRRRLRLALLALTLVLVALVVDGALVSARVDRLDVDLSGGAGDADGRTWVLVGLDSRADLPDGAPVSHFGTVGDVPGTRTDVVVVVHQTDAGTTVFSVPRDVVTNTERRFDRLALAWLDGPQGTVEALCDLGIPTDHLVTVDLRGFAAVVDAAGGLDVDVPQPVRDSYSGLELTTPGRQHVDGVTALAMVRSRHPEHLVDGQWTPVAADPDGRATEAGVILTELLDQVRGSLLRPWRLQSVAWAAAGAVQVDPGTSTAELASLARTDLGAVQVLPVGPPLGASIARLPIPETHTALRAAGLSCAG
ncbi:LCP family protein [Modestobacter sp. VKM Ac-2986]|uniref:LCP family protein n=1 Tax=Modestobacter sp. VKM Ac-2986 TaxID=3004140 RepID=UPI0022AB7C4B|nr:LCP family protein [Modestobacter sp. VKM Ac-2986]MCZ2829426.1 LCP family protein [Modestobacter sp. VKM Ac-2986]